jgi:thioester reductase-like protein
MATPSLKPDYSPNEQGVLVTGGTGFLGAEVISRLLSSIQLERRPEVVRVLVRGDDAEEKFRSLCKKVIAAKLDPTPLKLVRGDIQLENLGLGQSEFDTLAASTSRIIHSAASTHLGQSLELARDTNVRGTKNILNLAQKSREFGSFDTFFHVSTAYVAGDTTSTVRSSNLCLNRPFKNGYEQAKAEAEVLIRGANLNYCIYRPSIIVGDSESGITTSFNVLYVPVKFLVRGFFSALPFNSSTPFDVVPVNYVADALSALSGYSFVHPSGRIVRAGQRNSDCYHLTVGFGRESSPWEIVEFVLQAFNRSKLSKIGPLHIPALIPQEMLHLVHHSICVARTGVKSLEKLFTKKLGILSQILPFLPYLIRNPQFDSFETDRDLKGIVDQAPAFNSYAEKLFLYCMDSDWGRNPSAVAQIS